MLNAVITSFNSIKLIIDNAVDIFPSSLSVRNGDKYIGILETKILTNELTLLLKEELCIKDECYVKFNDLEVNALFIDIFETEEFNRRYYTKEELGFSYSKAVSSFKLWSPAAAAVNLLLYINGDSEIPEIPRRFPMHEESGLWSTSINEDLNGVFYTYEVTVYGQTKEAVDPYAKALGINGHRGAVVNLEQTNPVDFSEDCSPFLENFTDAIIYETSIRDISMHPDSGVTHRGKFIGLAEENTRSSKGLTTALSHIKELGVSHVQLMPIYDFSCESTDEKNPSKYNWGYDPQNYNAPEGSYSTNPYSPYTRIYELKTLIRALHENGLCVNMDVVFNHVYNLKTENLEKIFPGYYFRFFEDGKASNGSGCSNDTASERLMMRKFIVDSIFYWAKEFHLDGFRVDLMGLHDVTTMNAVRERLNTLGRPVMLYGEGWILGTLLKDEYKANQLNGYKMPHIGHFNDTMRNAVRGSVFIKEEKGFASGKQDMEEQIKYCVVGCTDYKNLGSSLFQTPDQAINYVSAHDNNTLWDKLKFSNAEDSVETLKAIQKLSNAIVFTSQGIAFMHSGVEFCRTKYGVEDSVRSEDKINWLDWERKAEFLDVVEYYKGLVKLRKEHSAFRMNSAEKIRRKLEFLHELPKNTVGFILKNYANNDIWKDIIVIYNANRHNVTVNIPDGNWCLVVDKANAGTNPLRYFSGNSVEVEAISMLVLHR